MTSFSQPHIQKRYKAMKKGGALLSQILHDALKMVGPDVTAESIDHFCFSEIKSAGAEPAFLGYQGYPYSLVLCLNDEIVHGLPLPEKIIADGDLVTLDLGLRLDGFVVDMARSRVVGSNEEGQKLINATKQALDAAIKFVKPGVTTGDIGHHIAKHATKNGYKVIHDCAGHGVGQSVHEPPNIANYGTPGQGEKIKAGMTIAIEPIFALSTNHGRTLADGWTMITEDGSLAAQTENTVIVTEDGCEILTK